MADFAVCRWDKDSESWVSVNPGYYITPAQAALGALDEETVRNLGRLGGKLSDGEAADILVRRLQLASWQPGNRERWAAGMVRQAEGLGLWPPEVGEDG